MFNCRTVSLIFEQGWPQARTSAVNNIEFMLFRKADALLKEKFQRPAKFVNQDAVQKRMAEYQALCFDFLAQETSNPAVRYLI